MFGRRFAYQSQGGDWEGWTPPWLQHERHEHHGHHTDHEHHRHHHEHHHGWRGPRFLGMRMRRGVFGPGGPFGPEGPLGPEGPFGPGPRGPFGPGGPGARFFGRGDVKFALLELLQERPMHGYEMMKALEEKSGGVYVPSAGSIYPTLQMLEDRGLVTVAESDGKKVYSITDAGRAFLNERHKEEEFAGPFWGRGRGFGPGGPGARWSSPEMQALRTEAGEVARLAAIAGRMAFNDPEQIARLRGILEHTRRELSDMIYGGAKTEGPSSTETPTTGEA